MYCEKCGAQNDDQSRICVNCGSLIGSDTQTAETPVQQFGAPYVAQQPAPTQALYGYDQQQAPYGQQQPQAPYAYAPQQAPYGQPPQPPAAKKKTGLIIAIVAVVAVAIIVGLVLLLSGGGGGDKGIVGKWTVISDDTAEYVPGLILNFQKNGKLKFEMSDAMSDTEKAAAAFLAMFELKYKTSGDTLEMTMEFFGEKNTESVKYKVEGDTLTLFDDSGKPATQLKRAK